jgi:diacylglycerol kinase family enzyme
VVRNPALVERLRQQLPRENLWVTADLSEVTPALEALAETGIDTLVLVGGDGSVTRTLTPLVRVWPHQSLPRVLLAGGGSINTIAKSLGVRGRPDFVLGRLLDGSAPAKEDMRPLLRIRADGTEPICGMIFANGAAPRWLEFYYAHTPPGVLGAAYGVAATLGSVVVGGELAQQVFGLFEAEVEVDSKPMELQRFLAMAAGGVRHIGLGFGPFITAGQKSDRFHWAATDMGGWRLGVQIPGLRLGLESALASLAHASPKRVVVRTAEAMPYTVDAELFPGVTSLSIEAGPEIRFLVV